jgi:hypothetical protein
MKFMLLIHQGTALDDWGSLSQEEQQAIGRAYQEVSATPGVTPGQWMQPPEKAKTVRVKDGKPFTSDGPFADTKEAVGGYLLYDAESWDDALALAARIPAAQRGGAVEVRPLVEG